MADGVMMPSAEQLQAAQAPDSLAPEGQSIGLVARILAESLGGGGDGPDLDALISALGGAEGGNSGLAEIASRAAHSSGSSGWQMADFPGSAAIHGIYDMHPLGVHQDVAPQV